MVVIFSFVALVLRMFAWRMQGSLWFDEVFSVHFSSMPLPAMITMLGHDVHPPLYAIVLSVWMEMFDGSDVAVRMLSVVCGTAAVGVIVAFVREQFGKGAAVIAGCLAAVSPVLLFVSVEARMYSLLLFLVSLGAFFGFRALFTVDKESDPERRFRTMVYALLCFVSAALTHVSGAVVAFTFAVIFLLKKDISWREKKRFALMFGIGMVPFCVWLGNAVLGRWGRVLNEWQFRELSTRSSIIENVATLMVGSSGLVAIVLGVVIVFALIFSYERIREMFSENVFRQKIVMLSIMAITPIIFFIPFTNTTPKYFIAAFPFFAAILGVAGSVLAQKTKEYHKILVIACVVVLFSASLAPSLNAFLFGEQRIQWDRLVQDLQHQEQSGDVVLIGWFSSALPFHRYYQGKLPVLVDLPNKNLSFDENLVLYAGQTRFDAQNTAQLVRGVRGQGRLFVISGGTITDNALLSYLVSNGWQFVERRDYGVLTPALFVFASSTMSGMIGPP